MAANPDSLLPTARKQSAQQKATRSQRSRRDFFPSKDAPPPPGGDGEQERRKREEDDLQVLAEGGFADGLALDGVPGEKEAAKGGGENFFLRRLGAGSREGGTACGKGAEDDKKDKGGVDRVEKVAGEMVAEGILSPDRGVEHKRGQVDGSVEIDHIHGNDPEGDEIPPVRGIMNEGLLQNDDDSVPYKAGAEGRQIKTESRRAKCEGCPEAPIRNLARGGTGQGGIWKGAGGHFDVFCGVGKR